MTAPQESLKMFTEGFNQSNPCPQRMLAAPANQPNRRARLNLHSVGGKNVRNNFDLVRLAQNCDGCARLNNTLTFFEHAKHAAHHFGLIGIEAGVMITVTKWAAMS